MIVPVSCLSIIQQAEQKNVVSQAAGFPRDQVCAVTNPEQLGEAVQVL